MTGYQQLPAFLKTLLVLIFIIVLIFFLIVGKSILIPLFLGGFFAILFTPIAEWLERKRIPKTLASVISLILMTLIVGGLLSFIIANVSEFTKDFGDVSERFYTYASQIDTWILDNLGMEYAIVEKIQVDSIREFLIDNSSSISTFVLKTVGSLSGVVLIPLFMFFLLLYRDHLTQVMVMLYSQHDPQKVTSQITKLRQVIQHYIIGVGKVMVILAILNISAYTALGIKHAIFFGFLGAILSIIPYVGPFFGVLFPFVYSLLTKDSFFYPLAVLVIYQIIQLLEGNFLTPKIVGGNVNLNAFVTLLGLLIGGTIWGIAGMILVIPALAILREIFELNESTRPFAYLLGEEKSKPKLKADE